MYMYINLHTVCVHASTCMHVHCTCICVYMFHVHVHCMSLAPSFPPTSLPQSLDSELKHNKSLLLSITKELEKITALLSQTTHDQLRELVYHVSQASKALVQIEKGLSAMEFGGVKVKVKGNGAKSSDQDYVEMSELEDSLKKLERKHSRVLPPVPVRNVNGAKAKESDYAHIEDLNVHGTGTKIRRKPTLLKPYAQVSMKDPPEETADTDTISTGTPTVPARRAMGEGKEGGSEKSRAAGVLDLKAGQSFGTCPSLHDLMRG